MEFKWIDERPSVDQIMETLCYIEQEENLQQKDFIDEVNIFTFSFFFLNINMSN